jgi:hypothetical protein
LFKRQDIEPVSVKVTQTFVLFSDEKKDRPLVILSIFFLEGRNLNICYLSKTGQEDCEMAVTATEV